MTSQITPLTRALLIGYLLVFAIVATRYSSSGSSLRPFLRGAYNRDSETLSVRA